MAGTLVQSRSVETTLTPAQLGFTSNVAAGNAIVVAFSFFKTGATDFTGTSDNNSNTYGQINTEQANTGGRLLAHYAKNVNAGATTVSCATTAAHPNGIAIEEWSGLDTTAPLADATGTTGTSAAPDGGNVTAPADGIVWGACSHIGGGTIAIGEGASFTLGTEQESTTNQPVHTENRGQGGGLAAGSYGAPHTLGSSQTWQAISAAFAAAPPAAVPRYHGLRRQGKTRYFGRRPSRTGS